MLWPVSFLFGMTFDIFPQTLISACAMLVFLFPLHTETSLLPSLSVMTQVCLSSESLSQISVKDREISLGLSF